MGNVDVKSVKELRGRTQAGFSDCQEALKVNGNDIEKSIIWLKKRGAVKAEKKSGAIAVEGLTNVIKKNNKVLIIEVNSQTDFVAKNAEFINLVKEIEEAIFESNVTDKEAVDQLKLKDGQTIHEASIQATAKIGEKISFRRADIVNFDDDVVIGIYQHHNGKFSSIVAIKGISNQVVANDVAMHLGAMNPKFLNSQSVDASWLAEQKKEITKKTKADFIEKSKKSGKAPEQKHIDKTVEGRLTKMLAEFSLEDQAFAKDPTMTVKKYISNNGDAKLIFMKRYELGEGIQRLETNFASEVAAQMKTK